MDRDCFIVRKYLKFVFEGSSYKFICLSSGWCTAPQMLTKIFETLHSIVTITRFQFGCFFGGFLLPGDKVEACEKNYYVVYR